jgi:glycosyltransferase involved in cell wall biosynthesis
VLSLVIIARDEADRIEACLASVPFASERLVLDSGSTDATVARAEAAGATVVRTDWPGHVAQKNRALAMAQGPWVLSLDADERLSDAAAAEVRDVMTNPGDRAGFSFPRGSIWLGWPIRHGRWYPDRKLRLVRKDRARWVGDDPHDRLEADGPVQPLSGDIVHVPYRDLSEHLATIDRYTRIHADALVRRGVRARWWHVAGGPPLHFVSAYLWKRGFLDGVPGLAVAGLGATYTLVKWVRVWLAQHEMAR